MLFANSCARFWETDSVPIWGSYGLIRQTLNNYKNKCMNISVTSVWRKSTGCNENTSGLWPRLGVRSRKASPKKWHLNSEIMEKRSERKHDPFQAEGRGYKEKRSPCGWNPETLGKEAGETGRGQITQGTGGRVKDPGFRILAPIINGKPLMGHFKQR